MNPRRATLALRVAPGVLPALRARAWRAAAAVGGIEWDAGGGRAARARSRAGPGDAGLGVGTDPPPARAALHDPVDAEGRVRWTRGGAGGEACVPTVVDTVALLPRARPRDAVAAPRLGWVVRRAPAPDTGHAGLRALLGRVGHRVRYVLDVVVGEDAGETPRFDVPGVVTRLRRRERGAEGSDAVDDVVSMLRAVDLVLLTGDPVDSAVSLLAGACGAATVSLEPAALRSGTERAGDGSVDCIAGLLRDPETRATEAVRARAELERSGAFGRAVGTLTGVLRDATGGAS